MMDGKTAKLIYCTLNEKCVSLDLQKREDQDILIDGARYASKEREVINARLTDGKDLGREDPECCIDPIPDGVEFKPYETQKTDNDGNKRTLVKGSFAYTDFAFNSVKPLIHHWLAGEPLYRLYRELGFKTLMGARHTLDNLWWLGYKHRTKTVTKKEWDVELNRLRHREIKDISEIKDTDKTRFVVATNLARTPLIPQDVFDAIQAKLAVRTAEYGTRRKPVDEFLASPKFHCKKCGAKMYPRKGCGGRPDTYTCASRYRFQNCSEHVYRHLDLDNAVDIKFYLILNDKAYLTAKAKEFMDEDHRAASKANLAAKERIVAKFQREVKNLAVLARGADDLPHS